MKEVYSKVKNQDGKQLIPFYKPVFTFEKKKAKMDRKEKEKAVKEIKAIIEEARRLEKILAE